MELNTTNAELFVRWVMQREVARLNKSMGAEPPWCEDPIVSSYHFCNVHRQDDRVTKELNAVASELALQRRHLPAFWTAARMFNHAPSVFLYCKYGLERLKATRDYGGKIFNTAYVVSTCGKSMDKIDYVHGVVNSVDNIAISDLYCHTAFRDLRTVDGLGSFMCGQIIADLKYTPYLADAPDWDSFAVMGPGSQKGMNLLVGAGTTERNFMDRLTFVREILDPELPRMHNQDFQNCLCEFSKYMRYKFNLPGRRRPYVQSSK